MNTVAILRERVQTAHQMLEATMADVQPEHLHWLPPGRANPLGASYAHALLEEDILVHGLLMHQPPLIATTWEGRAGLSEPMPDFAPEQWATYPQWTRRVRVDLDALRQYAQAVHAATDAYLATLDDADLSRTIDLSAIGMGQVSQAWYIGTGIAAHCDMMCGEISCLKGLQGAKGYPF